MMTIAELVAGLNALRPELAGYLAAKGVSASADEGLGALVDKVAGISTGGGGITPSGTVRITKNGTVDVTPYAAAEVDVPIPDGYIVPVGTATITENGEYDITEKAGVVVDVPGIELPALTDPAEPEEVFAGQEYIDGTGALKEGSFTIDSEIEEQDGLISQILTALEGKATGGDSAEPDPRDQYQRVEYITSDGAAYVITDFIADNSCGAEMVVSFPHFADHTWMGSREDSGSTRFFAPYAYSASIWYAGFNANVKISASTKIDTVYRCQANFLNSRLATVYDEADALKGSATISDTLTAHTYPVTLFTQNYAGTPRTPRVFSLYNARCSKGSDVVREYIPCRRKSDGMLGLYEKFTGTFLPPEEGTFSAGADIDW